MTGRQRIHDGIRAGRGNDGGLRNTSGGVEGRRTGGRPPPGPGSHPRPRWTSPGTRRRWRRRGGSATGKATGGVVVSLVDRAPEYTPVQRVDRRRADVVGKAMVDLPGSSGAHDHCGQWQGVRRSRGGGGGAGGQLPVRPPVPLMGTGAERTVTRDRRRARGAPEGRDYAPDPRDFRRLGRRIGWPGEGIRHHTALSGHSLRTGSAPAAETPGKGRALHFGLEVGI